MDSITTPTSNPIPPVPPVTPNIPPTPPQQNKSIGPMVATILIIVLLVLAAGYIWTQKTSSEPATLPEDTQTPLEQAPAESEESQYDNLEASLDASLDGLDDLNF